MTKPANATELLGLAHEKACVSGEWGATVRELKKGPWKWKQGPQVPIAKRQIGMTRGEAVRHGFGLGACLGGAMALTVTGTAEFKEEGRLLETTVMVQPHFPAEHEMLERVASLQQASGATMEKGQLVLRRTLIVPAVPENIAVPENTTAPSAGGGEPAEQGGEEEKAPVSKEQKPAPSKKKIDEKRGGKEVD